MGLNIKVYYFHHSASKYDTINYNKLTAFCCSPLFVFVLWTFSIYLSLSLFRPKNKTGNMTCNDEDDSNDFMLYLPIGVFSVSLRILEILDMVKLK